jgi:predicted ArsR family transcriptional regulator
MARLGQKLQMLMRQDGYVTAQEVADAVGLSLSAAHSRIGSSMGTGS